MHIYTCVAQAYYTGNYLGIPRARPEPQDLLYTTVIEMSHKTCKQSIYIRAYRLQREELEHIMYRDEKLIVTVSTVNIK